VAGENDDGRAAGDDTLLVKQFRAAGACVTARRIAVTLGDHSPSKADLTLIHDWFQSRCLG
jgi:hypothetical protein